MRRRHVIKLGIAASILFPAGAFAGNAVRAPFAKFAASNKRLAYLREAIPTILPAKDIAAWVMDHPFVAQALRKNIAWVQSNRPTPTN